MNTDGQGRRFYLPGLLRYSSITQYCLLSVIDTIVKETLHKRYQVLRDSPHKQNNPFASSHWIPLSLRSSCCFLSTSRQLLWRSRSVLNHVSSFVNIPSNMFCQLHGLEILTINKFRKANLDKESDTYMQERHEAMHQEINCVLQSEITAKKNY